MNHDGKQIRRAHKFSKLRWTYRRIPYYSILTMCTRILSISDSNVLHCSARRSYLSIEIPPSNLFAVNSNPYHDVAFVLNAVSEDELEIAARTNYSYAKEPSEEKKMMSAQAMTTRYLSSKSDKVKALAKMKATIQFRKDMDIDSLRDAPYDLTSPLHKPLLNFLSNKKLYVSGYDNEGRSTFIFKPRLVRDHCPKWTVNGHVYTMERAIACSKARDQTVNAVVDFSGFSFLRNTPPAALGKEIMLTLRNHYVGHIHQIFIIDAPAAFLCFWKIFEPFAGSTTRAKIKFLNSKAQKEEVIGRLYSKQEVASWMLPGGLKTESWTLMSTFSRHHLTGRLMSRVYIYIY